MHCNKLRISLYCDEIKFLFLIIEQLILLTILLITICKNFITYYEINIQQINEKIRNSQFNVTSIIIIKNEKKKNINEFYYWYCNNQKTIAISNLIIMRRNMRKKNYEKFFLRTKCKILYHSILLAFNVIFEKFFKIFFS